MRDKTIRRYLTIFNSVQCFTRDNLSIITNKEAKDVKNLRKEPIRVIHALRKMGYISIIPKRFYKPNKAKRLPDLYSTFWQLTFDGCERIGAGHKYIQHKYPKDIEHEIMKIDVVMSFISHYSEDYDLDISYSKSFSGYKPDAFIRMKHKVNGNSFDFLLELETGTRHISAEIKDKFAKTNNLDTKKERLSEHAKILVVQSHQSFFPAIRPVEYKDYKDRLTLMDRRTEAIIKAVRSAKNVKQPYRFLFVPFYKFVDLNLAVWQDLKGDKRRLV